MTAKILPFSETWRERMTEKRTGTSLCGWCLGPPGVRRPHRFGIEVAKCRCGCHRKQRRIEAATAVAQFLEMGEPNATSETTRDEGTTPAA